ncbi:MAG: lysophospholipid acyltransferase family protein [Bdellovibrionales bacterium]
MKQTLKAVLILILYRLLYFTWRIETIEPVSLKEKRKHGGLYILAAWHGNELAMLHIGLHHKLVALISMSKDGYLMNFVLKAFKYKTVRGSSSKGAISGFKALVKHIKNGYSSVFAVDGPRGPYRTIKPGVFESSRIASAPIYPSGIAISNYWLSRKSWNKAVLPKPFAKIVLVWGSPMDSISRDQDPRSLDLSEDLKNRMYAAEQEAQRLLAGL